MSRHKHEAAMALMDLLCSRFPKTFARYEKRRKPIEPVA
jgi:hypothetical protein